MARPIKVGIFFGGLSKEREVSFAGGRTVYDNLDKSLFTPIPIFVDSLGNFILLKWEHLYKGSIRDFHPATQLTPPSVFQPYIESLAPLDSIALEQYLTKIGQPLQPHAFSSLMDIAFLVMHGPYGEDGNIQGLLSWYRIPYTGTGIAGSAIGIDKILQKKLMQKAGFQVPAHHVISKKDWMASNNKGDLFQEVIKEVGMPFVIKSNQQGSSLGVSVVSERKLPVFEQAVQKAFFIKKVEPKVWKQYTKAEKQQWIAMLIDVREGIGLPVKVESESDIEQIIEHPNALLEYLNKYCSSKTKPLYLHHLHEETALMAEGYIEGKEFSCIVIESSEGKPIALPPTEMIFEDTHYDYRAKYLPGIARKKTPIGLKSSLVKKIRKECEKLFSELGFNVYARIDGFIQEDGTIYLNDPNTTAGMNPSSFLFHQAAEVGFNPSQFLTFLLHQSLQSKNNAGNVQCHQLSQGLEGAILEAKKEQGKKLRVGVLMGGFSAERHVSLEGGRNIYEKLASSTQYEPVPIFLSGSPHYHRLFKMPISMLLKENADDIHEQLLHGAASESEQILQNIRKETNSTVEAYSGDTQMKAIEITYDTLKAHIDFAFINIHGRPGEDGHIQSILEEQHFPFNGSSAKTSQTTINKYITNQLLKKKKFLVAPQVLVHKSDWEEDASKVLVQVKKTHKFPLIAKPVDEGCSAAVIKILNWEMLNAYLDASFREEETLAKEAMRTLGLSSNATFPQKESCLLEDFVEKGDATHHLEITGGMLTSFKQEKIQYEIFSPSEALATGAVLTLEEKFLAGEGQNITPARFHPDAKENQRIEKEVKATLKKVAFLLKIEGYARIDAFVKVYPDRIETWIIEVNTLPAMTPATCIFHQCALSGYKPLEFMDKIIQYGLEKNKK